jgi:hemerythrin-like domain-containing protein
MALPRKGTFDDTRCRRDVWDTRREERSRMADTRDMIGAHRCFRREFGALPGAVRRVADPDTGVVAEHAEFLVDLMHQHHRGEDTGVWPRLRERGTEDIWPIVEVMESQHAGLDRALEKIRAAARRLANDGSAENREALASAAEELIPPLAEHLDLEEEEALPLIDRYLTDEEWTAVVKDETATIPKSRLPLVFGMMLYDADDVMREAMKANMPRGMWPLFSRVARRVYRRHAQQVFGTRSPAHFGSAAGGAK